MNSNLLALTVTSIAVITGLMMAVQPTVDLGQIQSLVPSNGQDTSNNTGLKLGSAHEHAMMFVDINGTSLNFTDEKYQLNSRYVHLENNNSYIVHKHAEGVTWDYFFQTINTTVKTKDNQTCFSRYNSTTCGDIRIVLNGRLVSNLNTEIQQGDKLAILIGPEAHEKALQYMRKQLPKAYKPTEDRGHRI